VSWWSSLLSIRATWEIQGQEQCGEGEVRAFEPRDQRSQDPRESAAKESQPGSDGAMDKPMELPQSLQPLQPLRVLKVLKVRSLALSEGSQLSR